MFRDIKSIKSNRRRETLPRRSVTITRGSGYCQQPLSRHLLPSKQQLAAVTSTTHPAPLAFETLHQFSQDEGSRHNLSGMLSQLPDLPSTLSSLSRSSAALYYNHHSTASTAAASTVAIQSGWVFDLPGPFQGHPNIPKTIYSATCCSCSPPKTKQFSTNTYHKKKNPTPTPTQT